jgi:hypothetical protein
MLSHNWKPYILDGSERFRIRDIKGEKHTTSAADTERDNGTVTFLPGGVPNVEAVLDAVLDEIDIPKLYIHRRLIVTHPFIRSISSQERCFANSGGPEKDKLDPKFARTSVHSLL